MLNENINRQNNIDPLSDMWNNTLNYLSEGKITEA